MASMVSVNSQYMWGVLFAAALLVIAYALMYFEKNRRLQLVLIAVSIIVILTSASMALHDTQVRVDAEVNRLLEQLPDDARLYGADEQVPVEDMMEDAHFTFPTGEVHKNEDP